MSRHLLVLQDLDTGALRAIKGRVERTRFFKDNPGLIESVWDLEDPENPRPVLNSNNTKEEEEEEEIPRQALVRVRDLPSLHPQDVKGKKKKKKTKIPDEIRYAIERLGKEKEKEKRVVGGLGAPARRTGTDREAQAAAGVLGLAGVGTALAVRNLYQKGSKCASDLEDLKARLKTKESELLAYKTGDASLAKEVEALRARVKDAEARASQLAVCEQQKAQIEAALTARPTQETFDALKAQLQSCEAKILKLQGFETDVKRLEGELAGVVASRQDCLAQGSTDRARIQALDEEAKRLQVELDAAKVERTRADDAKSIAEAERARAEDAKALAESERKRLEDAKTDCEATRKRLEDENARAVGDKDKAEAERTRAENEKNTCEAARDQVEADLDAAIKDRTRADNEKNTCEAARDQAEAESKRAEAALDAAMKDRTRADDAKAQAEAARDKAESEKAQAEAARDKAEAARNAAVSEKAQAEAERNAAEAEKAQAEVERNAAEAAKDKAEAERQAAVDGKARCDDEIKRLREALDAAQNENAGCQKDLGFLGERAAEAQAKLADLEQRHKDLEAELAACRSAGGDYAALETRCAQAESEKDAQAAEVARLRADLEQCEDLKRQLESARDALASCESLKIEYESAAKRVVQNAQNELETYAADVKRLHDECEAESTAREKSLNEAQAKIKDFESKLDEAKTEVETCQNRVKSLEKAQEEEEEEEEEGKTELLRAWTVLSAAEANLVACQNNLGICNDASAAKEADLSKALQDLARALNESKATKEELAASENKHTDELNAKSVLISQQSDAILACDAEKVRLQSVVSDLEQQIRDLEGKKEKEEEKEKEESEECKQLRIALALQEPYEEEIVPYLILKPFVDDPNTFKPLLTRCLVRNKEEEDKEEWRDVGIEGLAIDVPCEDAKTLEIRVAGKLARVALLNPWTSSSRDLAEKWHMLDFKFNAWVSAGGNHTAKLLENYVPLDVGVKSVVLYNNAVTSPVPKASTGQELEAKARAGDEGRTFDTYVVWHPMYNNAGTMLGVSKQTRDLFKPVPSREIVWNNLVFSVALANMWDKTRRLTVLIEQLQDLGGDSAFAISSLIGFDARSRLIPALDFDVAVPFVDPLMRRFYVYLRTEGSGVGLLAHSDPLLLGLHSLNLKKREDDAARWQITPYPFLKLSPGNKTPKFLFIRNHLYVLDIDPVTRKALTMKIEVDPVHGTLFEPVSVLLGVQGDFACGWLVRGPLSSFKPQEPEPEPVQKTLGQKEREKASKGIFNYLLGRN